MANPSLTLAIVAIADHSFPSAAAVAEPLQRAGAFCDVSTPPDQSPGSVHLQLDGQEIVVQQMPAPIPWSSLEGPVKTAWFWPQATESLRYHSTHAVVVLVNPAGDAVDHAICLTRAVAAVVENCNAAGIYWGAGAAVSAPRQFLEAAGILSRQRLPLPLWMTFHLALEGNDSPVLFTQGMRQFGKLELELLGGAHTPAELFDLAFIAAHYILEHGIVLQDGHTLGPSAQERFPVRHRTPKWDPSQTAMTIDCRS